MVKTCSEPSRTTRSGMSQHKIVGRLGWRNWCARPGPCKMIGLVLWFVFFIVCSPLPPPLAGSGSISYAQGVADLENGVNAYYDGNFDQAISLLSQAIQGGLLSDPQTDTAYQFLGSSQFLKGDQETAKQSFRDLVVFNNNAQLDERFFTPEIVTAFNEVKAQYLTELTRAGFVKISGQPREAAILVDGKRRMNTTEPFKVMPGKHTVQVLQAGQVLRGEQAEIKTGETFTIDMGAKKGATGYLVLSVTPLDALIFIDGVAMQIAGTRAELPAGSHELKVLKEGYKTVTEKFSLKAGESKTLSVDLGSPMAAKPEGEGKPIFKKPVFWGIVGAAVIGGVILATGGGKKEQQPTTLPGPPPPPARR